MGCILVDVQIFVLMVVLVIVVKIAAMDVVAVEKVFVVIT